MENNTKELKNLHSDLLKIIFSYLDPEDSENVPKVCNTWKDIHNQLTTTNYNFLLTPKIQELKRENQNLELRQRKAYTIHQDAHNKISYTTKYTLVMICGLPIGIIFFLGSIAFIYDSFPFNTKDKVIKLGLGIACLAISGAFLWATKNLLQDCYSGCVDIFKTNKDLKTIDTKYTANQRFIGKIRSPLVDVEKQTLLENQNDNYGSVLVTPQGLK